MEIEFEIEPEDHLAFHRYHYDHPPKSSKGETTKKWIYIVVFGILAVVGILTGGWSYVTMMTLCPIVAVLALLLGQRPYQLYQVTLALRNPQNAKLLGWQRLELSPAGLTWACKESTVTTSWEAVGRIGVTEDHAFFYVSDRSGYILPKWPFS